MKLQFKSGLQAKQQQLIDTNVTVLYKSLILCRMYLPIPNDIIINVVAYN